jgi:hypothetical protein
MRCYRSINKYKLQDEEYPQWVYFGTQDELRKWVKDSSEPAAELAQELVIPDTKDAMLAAMNNASSDERHPGWATVAREWHGTNRGGLKLVEPEPENLEDWDDDKLQKEYEAAAAGGSVNRAADLLDEIRTRDHNNRRSGG